MCWNGHEDFQSYSPGRASARNCLMWNERVATGASAGMRWNDQECAGVGHSLGQLPPSVSMPANSGRPVRGPYSVTQPPSLRR